MSAVLRAEPGLVPGGRAATAFANIIRSLAVVAVFAGCVRSPTQHDAGTMHDAGTPCVDATKKLHVLLAAAPTACNDEKDCMQSPVQGRSCHPFVVSRRGFPEFYAEHGAAMRESRERIETECGPTKPCPEIPFVPKCVDGRCVNAP